MPQKIRATANLFTSSGVACLLRLLARQQEKLDLTRLMKLASFGALVHGSTGHFFYNFLDSKMPGTTALTVVKKVFIDQVSQSTPARSHRCDSFRGRYLSLTSNTATLCSLQCGRIRLPLLWFLEHTTFASPLVD